MLFELKTPFFNIRQSKIPNVMRVPFIRQNMLHVRRYSKTLIIQTKLLTALFKNNAETKEYIKFVET